MTDTTKRYRLRKELFNWTTGHIVQAGELFEQIPQTRKCQSENGWFVSESACLNKDYFEEEVLPVSEPVKERIEISDIEYTHSGCFNFRIKDYEVKDVELLLTKGGIIKSALESALNDTVVEDKVKLGINYYTQEGKKLCEWGSYEILFEQNQSIMAENKLLHKKLEQMQNQAQSLNESFIRPAINKPKSPFAEYQKNIASLSEKMYTQSEVDAIRKEAFEESRMAYRTLEHKNGKMIGDFLYPTFADYLSSLNLNTNDTGKPFNEKEYEEDKFKRMKKATEQPTNDNAFVWDEETAKEYGKFCVLNHSWLQWEDFKKQSKQSAPPSALPTKERYVPHLKDFVTMDGIIANVETVFHYKRTAGVVYVSGQKTVRDEWSFDRIEPLKIAPTPTEQVV